MNRATIKTVLIGLWACVIALASSYAAATWRMGSDSPPAAAAAPDKPVGTVLAGLEYRKPPSVTVPMISDGRLRGYVIAKLEFTADAKTLQAFPVDPQPFVMDEAFRRIYTDGKVEFDQISKYNLDEMTAAIKKNVNARLGSDLIHDILVDQVSYVDKDALKADTPHPAN